MSRRLRVFLLFAMGACREPEPSAVLLRLEPIGDDGYEARQLTQADFQSMLARRRLEQAGNIDAEPLRPEIREAILDELIDTELLLAEADRIGITSSSTLAQSELQSMKAGIPPDRFRRYLIDTYQSEASLLRAIKQRLRIERLVERSTPKVGRAEIEARWQTTPPNEKMKPARVRAAQILVSNEVAGREVKKRLDKGEAFEALARSHSIAPNAAAGGYLGWFARGEMPEVIESVCFRLAPDEISELTPSEYGYHLFKVYERTEARPLTLKEAAPRLAQDLRDAHGRETSEALLARVRSQMDVVQDEAAIKRLIREGL
ncbi:MAG: peptidylprolyl isomerase [Myxococcota bacterium]